MKEKRILQFLNDILSSFEKIEKYTEKITYKEFISDDKTVDAVLRNLEIIGEASRNIPEEVKKKFSEIPWKRMIGLRNVISHIYFKVDLEVIWQIITKNVPETKEMIIKLLDKYNEE